MRASRPGTAPHRRCGEEGIALVLAIVISLVVALIVAGIAQVLTADLDINRIALWDSTAQYLAQAGLEHQIYLLKADKTTTVGIPYTNFPVTADQRFWYTTTLTCLVNCSGNVSVRRWRIQSTGEIRQYSGGSYTVLQTRAIAAEVTITYDGLAPNLYAYPQRVTIQRWEEIP
jgi:Tfp pilus assembly protein PilX